MGNRSAKFVSTLVASIIAGVPLAAVSQTQNAPSTSQSAAAAQSTPSAATTADDCLASPKATAPQGQHWFYRIDRSKRKCWYLRAEGDKAARTSTTQNAQTATSTTSTEPAAPHSVQDARAEYVTAQAGTASNVTAPAPQQSPPASADSNAPQQAAVTTRWPDTSTTSVAPEPQSEAPTVTAEAQPSATPAQSPAPQSPAPVTPAAADAPAKPTGSLPTLLLVIGCALALAGVIGSVIYRFAGSRIRVQAADGPRRVNWDNWEQQDQDHSRAPWRDAGPAPSVQRPRPVDFDLVRPMASSPVAPRPLPPRPSAPRPLFARPRPISIVDNRDASQAHEKAVEDEHDRSEVEAFEAKTHAPQLAAIDAHIEEAPPEEAKAEETQIEQVEVEEAHVEEPDDFNADAVDIDVITQMLERLAKEGPRLMQPSPEADLADFAQNRRGQRAARA
ncbi:MULTISPECIES: hypothetical protein [unclassified Bradyrhizobium]|uniref:hypothetical protein n=1 Tax=unclassified Bradyrhizobium TaxID=2631580 RepID=UPI0024788667|nr:MULTISPECIES: hypothetical protein [unclassified Bradyrhizobium]WGR68306.1 hypothetical protein MTX24_22995 [Bradyrhizobium sp. ISRA426]WGR80361.1 hypothetical protein MTX21_08110 [Bradyrhizobium sp. ISRA430]WGR83546.1 hypothetical protein MTX25_22675 [Bradyrhizobium sp. ISRA432]